MQAEEKRYRQAVRDGLEDGERKVEMCEGEGRKERLSPAVSQDGKSLSKITANEPAGASMVFR